MEKIKMVTEKKEKSYYRLSDIYPTAHLIGRGFECTFQKKNKTIFFCFESSAELYKALGEFNEGCLVNIAEYTKQIKRLRALMYEAKTREDIPNVDN